MSKGASRAPEDTYLPTCIHVWTCVIKVNCIVQHEKIMHLDDHGALDWVTLLQMMVIKVGHVWTEGPPGPRKKSLGAAA